MASYDPDPLLINLSDPDPKFRITDPRILSIRRYLRIRNMCRFGSGLDADSNGYVDLGKTTWPSRKKKINKFNAF